ncbi:type III pantothenate kinase [Brevibacillus sp. SKDU10]|uniref:type III pantothenate kinase n=1 Tax=Brevibacillus sp. SKDU10 TaxID=1247872 RepID=UPI0007C8FBE2|nr:type III pantothenate kinase [Brevibacillus sp. SKDU10]OAJ72760.1 type III pantothenate kinase [Brevibacillus sp. SKDU10]
MLLVMDIGNTNIVLGMYQGDRLVYHWRIASDRNKTEDEFGMLVLNLFQNAKLTLEAVTGIIISSVVPPLNKAVESMCEKYFSKKPLLIGPGIKTGLNIKAEYPREVGADRIVNAVAAIHEYGAPLLIVDFGTATTFCYVDGKNQYLGGAIAPGIGISTEALFTRAAKLPRIEIAQPATVIGRNTIASMQSGIFYGFIGQVEGIVSRMKQECNSKPTVVATGGLAPLISKETDCIDVVDQHLTLKGLRLIYERNV